MDELKMTSEWDKVFPKSDSVDTTRSRSTTAMASR